MRCRAELKKIYQNYIYFITNMINKNMKLSTKIILKVLEITRNFNIDGNVEQS